MKKSDKTLKMNRAKNNVKNSFSKRNICWGFVIDKEKNTSVNVKEY